MSELAKRRDFGVRIAGEKAQMPDEFLTRSQVIPGTNVYFEYLSNHDVRINASVGYTPGIELPISILGIVSFAYRPPNTDATRHIAALDADYEEDGLSDEYPIYYGSSIYMDIFHNWNLLHQHDYILQINPLSTGKTHIGLNGSGYYGTVGFEALIHHHPLSGNAIRLFSSVPIMVTVPQSLDALDPVSPGWYKWNPGDDARDCKLRFPNTYSLENEELGLVHNFTYMDDPNAFSKAKYTRTFSFILRRIEPTNTSEYPDADWTNN